jgi:hypothetical protein
MTLRAVIVLGVLAVLAYRFLPRYKITWALPLTLGATIVVVRAFAYVVTDE